MATVGHGLVGLTLAGASPVRKIRARRSYLLPGMLILASYAVDLTEWTAIAINPDLTQRHLASHSPIAGTVIACAAALVTLIVCGTRNIIVAALAAAAVGLHVLMDRWSVRAGVVEWYTGRPAIESLADTVTAVSSEACVYGLPLVLILLVRGAADVQTGRGARRLCLLLAIGCVAGALIKSPAVWIPCYTLAAIHAVLMLRRRITWKLLTGALPLILLVPMVACEKLAHSRISQGQRLYSEKRYQEAYRMHRSALELPCRSAPATAYREMGLCLERMGDIPAALRAYQKAVELSEYSRWAEFLLARLYERYPESDVFKPQEAYAHYQRLASEPGVPPSIRKAATSAIERMRRLDMIE